MSHRLKPPPPRKPIVERAFELARSGEFDRLELAEKQLWSEGYAKGDNQLASPSLRKQLRALCMEAAKNV